jgi:hypothetical protein
VKFARDSCWLPASPQILFGEGNRVLVAGLDRAHESIEYFQEQREDTMSVMERWRARAAACATVTASALLLSAAVTSASDNNVKWKTIIGIIQAGNLVGNIAGGGQPWSTLGGNASVDLSSGRVEFEVRGLVLAGGNAIGTPGAINQVKGTIICNAGTTNTTIDTPLVTLDARGNAEFSGNVGPIAATCTPANVAFLVRIAADRWIANGSVRQ